MTPAPYTEDTLVQQTTADYLEQQLGWESIYSHNAEDFGPNSLLGRASDREVVLTRYLYAALRLLNPGLPDAAYDDAVRQISATAASQTLVAANREQYDLLRDGVPVTFQNDKGERVRQWLRVCDFEKPENNHFLCVRELWVRGDLYRRRADIMGFVNGLPLLFIECKNIHRNLKAAFEQNFSDYKTTIPHLFHHNAIVMFGNGEQAKIGSITSQWEHFHEWKRLAEEEPGVVDMETLLKGVCDKRNFMDLVENFILFDESFGETRKILARNHQFLGVNRAIGAVRKRKTRDGKLGVFWHTQGAGKSYSMVMCREVFRKFRACINASGVNYHRTDRDAIDIIYKSLQQDREQADISDILRTLSEVASEAVEVQLDTTVAQPLYDISRIDFERLRQEFKRSDRRRTGVQRLKSSVEEKLQRMLERNPLRTDFQQRYEDIVAAYNREKDRPTIEQTFEELLDLVQELDQEESRAAREGLDEESLAIFDLLRKPNLSASDRERIKQVAVELLKTLKAGKLRVNQWRDKEATRDAIRVAIRDFLWSDETGLPLDDYSAAEVGTKTDDVFRHVFRVYPTVPSPYCENAA